MSIARSFYCNVSLITSRLYLVKKKENFIPPFIASNFPFDDSYLEISLSQPLLLCQRYPVLQFLFFPSKKPVAFTLVENTIPISDLINVERVVPLTDTNDRIFNLRKSENIAISCLIAVLWSIRAFWIEDHDLDTFFRRKNAYAWPYENVTF